MIETLKDYIKKLQK